MLRRLLALVLFATITAGQAEAGLLSLNYSGVTDEFSSLDGSPIDAGTPFEVHAIFDSTPFISDIGDGIYLPTSITAVVGGTSYSAIFSPFDYGIELLDPTSGFFGGIFYFPVIFGPGFSDVFAPAYLTATPDLDAAAATPTNFSDYLGSIGSEMSFSTAAGELFLTYNPLDTEIIASITAVPEPASVGLVLMGCAGGFAWVRIRRRASTVA